MTKISPRTLGRLLAAAIVAGITVLGFWTAPALAAGTHHHHSTHHHRAHHHRHSAPRAAGTTSANPAAALDRDCGAGAGPGCAASTLVFGGSAPMANPAVAAGGAALAAAAVLTLRRRGVRAAG